MPGSIADFKASFVNDLARANRFDVTISPPLSLWWANSVSQKQLKYRCEVSQLPGRTLATTERKTYGPIEKLPYITTYNDIDLTFLIDGDMGIKYLFDSWMNLVNPQSTNNFNYKSDYASSIIINQYGVDNKLVYTAELFDAYPISINQMDLDWASDAPHKLTVTFAYTKWQNNSILNYINN
jgi:hypothetical protein